MEKKVTKVIFSIGSNVMAERHLLEARVMIEDYFTGKIHWSEKMWTEPIGFKGDNFLNVLGVGTTNLKMKDLVICVKAIERTLGRRFEDKKRGIVAMDIDILKYGDEVYHDTDWQRPFVQKMMKDIEEYL